MLLAAYLLSSLCRSLWSYEISFRQITCICFHIVDTKIEQDGCLTGSENVDVTLKVDLSSWSEGDGGVQDESEAGWEFVLDEDTGESRWSAEKPLLEETVDGEESGDQRSEEELWCGLDAEEYWERFTSEEENWWWNAKVDYEQWGEDSF